LARFDIWPVLLCLWNLEVVSQDMPSGRRIELPLYIVTVSPSESNPCRYGTGGAGGIEAVRQRDSDEVADQVAIVEIVPYVNGCGETGKAQRFGQGITERGSLGGQFKTGH